MYNKVFLIRYRNNLTAVNNSIHTPIMVYSFVYKISVERFLSCAFYIMSIQDKN